MKKTGSIHLLCFILILSVLPGKSSAENRMQVAYPTFVPFHYLAEDGTMRGLFYEILTEAIENRLGIPIHWVAYPWSRCQQSVKVGEVDAIMTVPTEERAEYTAPSKQPFYRKPLHVFTYTGHPQSWAIENITDISDIKNFGLSIITYSNNGWHKENVSSIGIKTYETGNLDSVWLMLARKRGDLVIGWPASSWPDIRRLGVEKEVMDTGVAISSMAFHLLIGRQSQYVAILNDFDNTIASMRQDGTMTAIEKRYQ